MIDDQDLRILRYYQNAPQSSKRAMARELGLSPAVLQRKLNKLEEKAVIRARRAEVNWAAFGFTVRVFLRVTLDKTEPDAWGKFLSAAKEMPEIVVIETLVGRVDIRMDVMARDLAHYQEIYVEKILSLPHILDIESLLLVSEIKNTARLPL